MNYKDILDSMESSLKKQVTSFKEKMMEIRSGRLSPSLVEDIKVECFDSTMTIKELGSISSPAPHQILIELWDDGYKEDVIEAIEAEDLGTSVKVDDKSIYLSAAPVSPENKKKLLDNLKDVKEKYFQRIRDIRDDAWKKIQEGEQEGEIREDDKYKGKDKMEEIVRDHRSQIKEMVERKEKEIKR